MGKPRISRELFTVAEWWERKKTRLLSREGYSSEEELFQAKGCTKEEFLKQVDEIAEELLWIERCRKPIKIPFDAN